MWLKKAAAAGFTDIKVLSRQPMGEDRLTLYPIYQEGSLDALFDLVQPEDRWRIVVSATIHAAKPELRPKADRKPGRTGSADAEHGSMQVGGESMFSRFDEFFDTVYADDGVFDRKTKHLIALAASLGAGCEP